MIPAPHTLTDEELLRVHADSPLAPLLAAALDRLEVAGKLITAARTLQEFADQCAGFLEQQDMAHVFEKLPAKLEELNKASLAFGELDDGELGS